MTRGRRTKSLPTCDEDKDGDDGDLTEAEACGSRGVDTLSFQHASSACLWEVGGKECVTNTCPLCV